ncbi:MAG: hypothetical protein WAP51_03550 [Candidatus Sungiibacteriota bacterium]
MTAFYIFIGIAFALSIFTIISLVRGAGKNRQDWRRVEPGKNSKNDWREVEPGGSKNDWREMDPGQ